MTTRTGLALLLVAAALAGCGPSTPPPNAGDKDKPPPLDTPPPATASASGSATPPPAPTASGDKGKGMKALEAGDLAGAKTAFEAAQKANPKDAEVVYYLGLVAEKSGDKAGAERGYREALKMKPDLDAAATNLGALLVEAGKVDDAITVLKGAIARRPDAGELRLNLAVALAQKGDQAAATKEFDEAVKLQGKDPIYLVTYAQWLGQWKQTDAAVAKLKAASALAGQDVGVLASIGFEMKNVGAFADCVTVLDKAVGLKDAAELRTYRALCKLGNKDKAGSLADLEAAVKKEPSYGPAHFYLGGRYADAGKWAEVIQEYEAYLKIEPKGPLAKQAEERIKRAKTKLKK